MQIWLPIHPLEYEISCLKESVPPAPMPKKTPTGSAQKTICPPPLRWWGGGIKNMETSYLEQNFKEMILNLILTITFQLESRPQGYRTFFMLNSTEHKFNYS